MAKRGPKVKFSRTRDAAAIFAAVRAEMGYRRALRDVSALLSVPERNIERELDPATTFLSGECTEPLALCGIAANSRLIRVNLINKAIDGIDGWPEPYRKALAQLVPGADSK